MKKILVVFLALLTILSLMFVACNKDGGGTSGGNNGDDDLVANTPPSGDEGNGDEGNGDEGNGEGNNGGNTTNTVTWENLGAEGQGITVYSMVDGLNVRKTANANVSNNKYTDKLGIGDSITAKAKATIKVNNVEYDWYKVDFNGQEGFVLAEYMTSNVKDTNFIRLDNPETLIIKEPTEGQSYDTNAREYPAFGNYTSAVVLAYEAKADSNQLSTKDGQLKKVAVNESGNIWEVEYTKVGETTSKTYYIGNLAFENFQGYGSTGGVG